MFKPVASLVLASMVLAGCATVRDSRVNPLNWFGRSQSVPATGPVETEVNPLIPRNSESIFRQEKDASYRGTLLGEITELAVERRPGGAIIRAKAVADQLGAYELKLVPVEAESDGRTLTFDFRGLQPRQSQGPVASRTHTVAIWMTEKELLDIREIRVKAARNTRTVRR